MTRQPPEQRPEDDPLYRAIIAVLVGTVMLGAVLTLTGETLFGSRPLASVGLGMAVLAGIAYWGLRLKARAAARRRRDAGGDRDDGPGRP
ncbi:hypothetical protein [Pelagibius sp.]|uniref:hypothetical protein n=1 Tax=Pelagibius sp. TaxID=1931238 RepID=UPI0026219928|nr:hypothetical protein [Pelagibius sp.]